MLPRRAARWRASTPTKIERRFPEDAAPRRRLQPRRVRRPGRPFNLAKLMVGSEGTLGVVARGQDQPGAAAEAPRRCSRSSSRTCSKRSRRRRSILRAPAVGRRGDGQLHPRPHAAERRRSTRMRRSFIEGDPGALLCVEFYADRAEDLPPRLAGARSATCARSGFGYRYHHALDLAGAGAHLEPARSGARAVDGDEGRRQVAVVRRRHRGRAGAAARLHRALPRDRPAARHDAPASTRTRRSAACTCGRSST